MGATLPAAPGESEEVMKREAESVFARCVRDLRAGPLSVLSEQELGRIIGWFHCICADGFTRGEVSGYARAERESSDAKS